MDVTDNYMNRNMQCNCNMNDNMMLANMQMNNNMMNNSCCCCKPSKQEPTATYSYEFTNMENNEPEEEQTRGEMLQQIRCLGFAVVDIAQYLNTHPDDRKALCLHREYSERLKDLKDKYQKVYGPLSIYYPCNSWRWLEEPWPWERSDF